MKFIEKPFKQGFDVIIKQTRPTLDIERDKYPEEMVTFYLNGSTGKKSHCLDDVIREGIIPRIMTLQEWKISNIFMAAQWDEEQNCIFFHLLNRETSRLYTSNARYYYREFCRFIVTKDYAYYKKEGFRERGSSRTVYCTPSSWSVPEDGEYLRDFSSLKDGLPLTASQYEQLVKGGTLNPETGEYNGMMKVLSHLFPAVFNVSGNKFLPITDYKNFYEYCSVIAKGMTCLKKSGAKQNYIDKMISLSMPPVEKPQLKYESMNQVKFAVIHKVEGADIPTCCIRTLTYIKSEDIVFEGGRIYVSKKSAEFCKINNEGEWVAQPFPKKSEHWDFSLNNFDMAVTKDTILEYFGEIVDELHPDYRAVAIWLLIEEPFCESIAKLIGIEVIENLIDLMQDACMDIKNAIRSSFGAREDKKVLKALGLSKLQFEVIKEYLPYSIAKPFYDIKTNQSCVCLGMLAFMKEMMSGLETGDVSSVDIDSFKSYLDFAVNFYSLFDLHPGQEKRIFDVMSRIIDINNTVERHFPSFDRKRLFEIYLKLADDSITNYYRYEQHFHMFRDYLLMAATLENAADFKPNIREIDEIRIMHDNVALLYNMQRDGQNYDKSLFKSRSMEWEKYEFTPQEKDNQQFMVVAPKTPYEMAKEGTVLHHCVKNYINRVARGETNILFIRKKDDPLTPFFTVEVSNEKNIEQVHGFGNCNADTVEGLEAFVRFWAKKKHLKLHSINKVR